MSQTMRPPRSCPACGKTFPDEVSLPLHCPHCGALTDKERWRSHRIVDMRWRFLATLLDHGFFFVLWWVLLWGLTAVGFSIATPQQANAQTILQTTLYFAYFTCTTWIWGGSPGKRVFGIFVVRSIDATPPSFGALLLREVLGRALCLFLAPIGYVTVVSRHSRLQTWADILGKTVVIYKRNPTPSSP